MSTIGRREVLGGASAVIALGTVGSGSALACTVGLQPRDDSSFPAFIEISAALTGIACSQLRPPADPTMFQIKLPYFQLVKGSPAFPVLLKAFQDHVAKDDPEQRKAAAAILHHPDRGVRILANQIILMWYFGRQFSWAAATPSQSASNPASLEEPAGFATINADAYTQSWIWRIAQAHPMGYSNFRFGHWSEDPAEPQSLSHFILEGAS